MKSLGSAGKVITQQTLAEYVEVSERLRRLEAQKQAMRQQLIASLAEGALVEGGDFVVRLSVQVSKRPTWAKLADAIGEAQADELRALIEPTTTQRLEVKPAPVADSDRRPVPIAVPLACDDSE